MLSAFLVLLVATPMTSFSLTTNWPETLSTMKDSYNSIEKQFCDTAEHSDSKSGQDLAQLAAELCYAKDSLSMILHYNLPTHGSLTNAELCTNAASEINFAIEKAIWSLLKYSSYSVHLVDSIRSIRNQIRIVTEQQSLSACTGPSEYVEQIRALSRTIKKELYI